MPVISNHFSQSGPVRRLKFLYLGAPGSLPEGLRDRVRSLNLEHVSPATLVRPEISRRPPSAASGGPALLALMRNWFWARKPDAGFVLEGFPATLLHARVFDEWLDARAEALDGCFGAECAADPSVVAHYRTHGLLRESLDFAA